MMEDQTYANYNAILVLFSGAHRMGLNATGSKNHSLSIVRLETRRCEVLGNMQRFRDQGGALSEVADYLLFLGEIQDAVRYYQRARSLAEAHGFFSVECKACLGLGKLAVLEGQKEEGVELLRNALVCLPLCEEEDAMLELNVLHAFTNALFLTHAIDEAEPLVARYREAAKAQSDKQGRLRYEFLHSFYTSARLHEVLCTCTPCGIPFTMLCPGISPRPRASVTGIATPAQRHMHLLNLTLSPGTREA
jgi:tetratricopeptide (TPR) repeat protein